VGRSGRRDSEHDHDGEGESRIAFTVVDVRIL
jgi:hypothetical protein